MFFQQPALMLALWQSLRKGKNTSQLATHGSMQSTNRELLRLRVQKFTLLGFFFGLIGQTLKYAFKHKMPTISEGNICLLRP